jgi:hypothetical protein
MELRSVIAAVLSGSIALGPMVFALFEYTRLIDKFPLEWKRVIIAAVSGLAGVLIWEFAVYMGYVAFPDSRQVVADAIWTHGVLTAFSAFTSATLIHGFKRGK